MFLKYVEIKGFKSFSDKTEILFNSGITAIVGPNGSGKSNISDAIRWVLGEQSVKALRGGKMEDVIFAGTAFRKPINVCEVSLCFDNNSGMLPIEFNEVLVKRRLYRDGDSDYYINNTQCRLKDVNELFMDTGIGKEGYSIIGQGKIDAILSGKPDDRRGLIEEASGIVKFKWRKEEAQKKIENYESNLIRLNDIIVTYEERIEPLRIESEKAKSFVLLSNELKQKDIDIKVFEIERIQETLEETYKYLKEKNVVLNELELDRLSLKSFFNETDFKLTQIEKELSEKTNDQSILKDKINEISTSKLIFKEKIENLKNNLIYTKEEISTKEDLTTQKSNFVKLEEIEKNKIHEEYEKLKQSFASLENKLNHTQDNINLYDNKYNKITNHNNKIKDKLLQIKNTLSNLQNKEKYEKQRHESIILNKDNLLKKQVNIKDDIDNLNNVLNNKFKYAMELEDNLSNSNIKINSLKKERKKINDELNDFLREKSKLTANLQMLKNLETHYEGYNKASKIIIDFARNNKDEFSSVLGEIIKVKDGMELAIEISLGSSISDVIVKSENIAKEYIEYLKNTRSGRVTFLPINILKPKKIALPKEIQSMDGYIGLASDLVQYDEGYQVAINFALSRTVIVKDMDSALLIAKKGEYAFRIVTIAGETINVGGSLTGGSNSKNYGILSRKNEIQKLQHKIENLDNNLSEIENSILDINGDIRREDDLNKNYVSSINQVNIEMAEIKSKNSSYNNELNSIELGLNENNEICNIIILNLKSMELEILKINEEEINLNNEKLKFEEEIKEIEKKLINLNEEKEEVKESLTEIKISKAKYTEMLISKDEFIKRLKGEIEVLINEISLLDKKIVSFNCEINEKEKHISEFEEDLIKIKKNFLKLENEINDLEVNHIKLKDENNKRKSMVDDKDREISSIENEIHKREMVKIKYETEKDNIFKNINDEYGMTYAEILSISKKHENISELKKDIINLKNKINMLGIVNVASIEEYKEVNEKYNFMVSQKEDMMRTKEELNKLIWDLTSKMEEIFIENFNILKKYFDETFKELFNGGTGNLILKEDDILNGNIEINVEPPGKKLQNINLLSGGEKGLSAIALLFAILKMKPTAFCLLDEIEASLDDANVIRFADYLKKLKNNTQFVIITHRKGTMEVSDSLYGVTMEEKGISKVVSVSLSDSERFSGVIDV